MGMNLKLASWVVVPPELQCIAGHFEICSVVFTKAKHMSFLLPSNSALKCMPNRNECFCARIFIAVPFSEAKPWRELRHVHQ